MVLQWCYNGVTVVLQWCYSGVTVPAAQVQFEGCCTREQCAEVNRLCTLCVSVCVCLCVCVCVCVVVVIVMTYPGVNEL
jgi:hypothetical protein